METERFPLYKREPKPNVITNGQFVAEDNSVHPSGFNVIVTGSKNDVGSGTKNISIFNSSGCTVASGVHGVTLINTSGVVVTDSDTTYINGNLVSNTPKKVYRATLTQSGTSAPVATVFENTIGSIVWSRTATGTYYGSLTGAFTNNKTWPLIGQSAFNNGVNYATYIDVISADQVFIQTIDQNAAGAPVDDQLFKTAILIEVNT